MRPFTGGGGGRRSGRFDPGNSGGGDEAHKSGRLWGKNPGKTGILAAIMAKRTGRPVKAVFFRAEDLIGAHHRISYQTYHKIGG